MKERQIPHPWASCLLPVRVVIWDLLGIVSSGDEDKTKLIVLWEGQYFWWQSTLTVAITLCSIERTVNVNLKL